MNRYNDEMDKILHEQISNIKIEGFSKDEIKEIIFKAKQRQKIRKIKLYKMAACFVLLILASFVGVAYCVINKSENTNTIIQGNIDNNEDNIAIIDASYGPNDITGLYVDETCEELCEEAHVVAIVKIENGLNVTNYDKTYGRNVVDGEYDFVDVRTIGKLTIIDSFKGDIDNGETIEFRLHGGTILYTEYIKRFDKYPSLSRDTEIDNQYKELSSKGIDKVYVNKRRKDTIYVEEGKTYLVHMYKNVLGDYELMVGLDAIREYDMKNDKILNNRNNQWESINIDRKEVKK